MSESNNDNDEVLPAILSVFVPYVGEVKHANVAAPATGDIVHGGGDVHQGQSPVVIVQDWVSAAGVGLS